MSHICNYILLFLIGGYYDKLHFISFQVRPKFYSLFFFLVSFVFVAFLNTVEPPKAHFLMTQFPSYVVSREEMCLSCYPDFPIKMQLNAWAM